MVKNSSPVLTWNTTDSQYEAQWANDAQGNKSYYSRNKDNNTNYTNALYVQRGKAFDAKAYRVTNHCILKR
jgi:hypothetical protein